MPEAVYHAERPLARRKGRPRVSGAETEAVRDAEVVNREGLHARPASRFVDLASRFEADVTVQNVTRDGELVDGKSAMQMVLLEATQGCVLRIQTRGSDAEEAADTLAALVASGFEAEPQQNSR